jgi:gamma-glutamyltranspeptidase/glutathione hydrolase
LRANSRNGVSDVDGDSHFEGFMRFLRILALVVLCACDGETSAPAPAGPEAAARDDLAERWFISAANPYAARAGAEILRKGGSAVDAAIATQAVLGLVEPQSSGLGGGAFLIHYDPAANRLETFNGREWAPASARPDRFLDETGAPMRFSDAVASGLSVGVPGVVAMLDLAHGEYGVLPWADLFAPAIALSEQGFEVSPRLHDLLSRFSQLQKFPAARAYFYDEGGAARPAGYVLKNPDYAETLKMIAEGGADAFYNGPIARMIVDAVNAAPRPGGMTLSDFTEYEAAKVDPACMPYRVYFVCSMAPPSSGGVTTLQILALLEPFDIAGAGAHSIEALHLLFEASRLAYADRNQYLADNDMLAQAGGLSGEMAVSGLLNPDYLAARAALIDPSRAAEAVEAGDPSQFVPDENAGKWRDLAQDASPEPPSTSHFVIVDGRGRVVSMTTTVESAFGSNLMAGGMILNNQLTDFSFLPERDGKPIANAVGPRKRPRSSMAPTIVFDQDGRFWSALGSPGGPAIIGYVAKTLIAMIDWNMSAQEAIDLPNAVYPRGDPVLEDGGFDAQILAGLRARGHTPGERALASGVHAVRVLSDGSFDGGADSRREGIWLTGEVETAD